MVRIRTDVGAEADFLNLDNMFLETIEKPIGLCKIIFIEPTDVPLLPT